MPGPWNVLQVLVVRLISCRLPACAMHLCSCTLGGTRSAVHFFQCKRAALYHVCESMLLYSAFMRDMMGCSDSSQTPYASSMQHHIESATSNRSAKLVLPTLQVPMKYMSAFTASKYALMGYTEAVRAELAPLNVHVGQVYPGEQYYWAVHRRYTAHWQGAPGSQAQQCGPCSWVVMGWLGTAFMVPFQKNTA